MKQLKLKKTWLKIAGGGLLAATMLTGILGCDHDYRVRSVSYGSSYYHPFDYYYYPYSRVYFSISTGYYYYPDGDRWIKVRTLPPRYYLDRRDRVTLKIKSNVRPYMYHHQHRVRYAPRPNYRVDRNRDRVERNLNRERYKKYRRR